MHVHEPRCITDLGQRADSAPPWAGRTVVAVVRRRRCTREGALRMEAAGEVGAMAACTGAAHVVRAPSAQSYALAASSSEAYRPPLSTHVPCVRALGES
jgi:hypothetical protein